ncbi:hypothetical protein Bca52824_016839 [Brassica carinata]|uniref:Rab-GAP TBC domain-containing protein n=1 Tax=Brassica carinata TaxID=52824 RepID=A0A8X7W575_BRACI|nr:hypothetical protein Bca52824_016839 [Brassica carinata]
MAQSSDVSSVESVYFPIYSFLLYYSPCCCCSLPRPLSGIPSIKDAVWEFLLGCYDPDSTFDERTKLKNLRRYVCTVILDCSNHKLTFEMGIREQYAAWKEECKTMVPVVGSGTRSLWLLFLKMGNQLMNLLLKIKVSSSKTLLKTRGSSPMDALLASDRGFSAGLDVARTDRHLSFYEDGGNQSNLWDVLAIYTWLNLDIGYVQGVNDIRSPVIILFEDEADAFWCFERAMRRLRENIRATATSMGVQTQLGVLSQVIKTVDPRPDQHLEDLDGVEYLFAIRMSMVVFRREFSFLDTLYLWELMWAMEYNPNMFATYEELEDRNNNNNDTADDPKLLKRFGKFERKYVNSGKNERHSNTIAVFVVASVLQTKNKRLLKEAKGLDDVVQILGDIAGNLDGKKAYKEALKIHEKFLKEANRQ